MRTRVMYCTCVCKCVCSTTMFRIVGILSHADKYVNDAHAAPARSRNAAKQADVTIGEIYVNTRVYSSWRLGSSACCCCCAVLE